jgi:peptidoglycan/xylan/chitin deacetylase (PgdA/CDA1 family)
MTGPDHPSDSSERRTTPPARRHTRETARTRARRRGAALTATLVGALVLALALTAGGGSHGHAHSPASAPAAPAGGAGATRSRGRAASVPTTASQAAGESGEVRRLVALGMPIYCAGPHGNEVALTFDDGPGPYTQLVIAKLRKHGVKATFFDVGRNLDLVAGATRQERALGAVGDHTFTHPPLTALPVGEAEQEIVRTQRALALSSGAPVFLFRPPYGARNTRIDAITRAHGMLEIIWTVDSADSLGASYAQIERNVIAGLRPGAIVLMHENHGQTVRALLSIFAALQRKHLRAVSVPQLLTEDPPSLALVRAGGAGCGVRKGNPLGGG